MGQRPPQLRVILIGGPSNAGKSTLAQALAQQLGWTYQSTDRLGRYPGRPWMTSQGPFPQHLIDHYSSMSVEELFEGVRNHYRSMWPKIESLTMKHANDFSTEPLVLEGSAIWPVSVATLTHENVTALWVVPSDELLQSRIYRASQFDDATDREKAIIQKFMGRAFLYNQRMKGAVKQLGLATIAVDEASTVEELTSRCLEIINQKHRTLDNRTWMNKNRTKD